MVIAAHQPFGSKINAIEDGTVVDAVEPLGNNSIEDGDDVGESLSLCVVHSDRHCFSRTVVFDSTKYKILRLLIITRIVILHFV